MQAVHHFDAITEMIAQSDFALFDDVALHDKDLVSAEQINRRVLRNGQNLINLVGLNRGFDE